MRTVTGRRLTWLGRFAIPIPSLTGASDIATNSEGDNRCQQKSFENHAPYLPLFGSHPAIKELTQLLCSSKDASDVFHIGIMIF